jgi:glycosyltransferase involved in cell wall biosynthesis
MNILFIARSSLFVQAGGDTQQIVQTAKSLEEIGVAVTIKLRGEPVDFAAFDLIHFFNAGRPADILDVLPILKQPLVVSSIWVDYSEWDQAQTGFRGYLARQAGKFGLEYLKSIGRGVSGSDKFPSIRYLLKGQKKAMQELLTRADAIVASSESERKRLDSAFSVTEKTSVIPLGVNPELILSEDAEERSGVICVGRIEGLKNQLNLIRAANGADWNLKIIGKAAINQPQYYAQCRREAGATIEFAGWLNVEHLAQAYKQARVLVLPSYFETFGLVALEAMANGCNVVLSNRPDMNGIFADKAIFCNPDNPEDIRQKVEEALRLPPYIFSESEVNIYNWLAHAAQLKAIYNHLLTSR